MNLEVLLKEFSILFILISGLRLDIESIEVKLPNGIVVLVK